MDAQTLFLLAVPILLILLDRHFSRQHPQTSEAGFAWGALIPLAVSAIGSLLKGKGESKQAQQQHEQGRAEFERGEANAAARAQLARRVLGGMGIGGAIDPALLTRMGTASPFPAAATGGSTMRALGGFLGGAAPYVGAAMSGGGGGRPDTEASEAGGLYGPPEPTSPPMTDVTGQQFASQQAIDDYLKEQGF